MGLILALAGVVALAAAVAVLLRVRRAREAARKAAARRAPRDPFDPGQDTAGDPRRLKAGDMVEYLGERLFVRGSLRLRQGGFTWSEHYLDAMDGTEEGRRWLSVEEDPDLEVVLWTEYRGDELLPSKKTLTVEGVTYHRSEHGTADYRSEGTTGLGATGRMEYADFDAPGGRGLAFERFLGDGGRGTWEVSLGERVPGGTLVIYPGGDA
ncbi:MULTISPECIES: DUF4178 domain-containing protein [unclassified Streptomyces]|uniref:DUF4178 domain-containing protein n=1 Tax=Streptomyces johnsoniae TaxID=3075532 RepID=A0ABU2S4L9_9ACTN|nr:MULTISPECIES: DUF4178 domain-containing protein [unclassified Streptomyces]MDT0443936.1 DUF4178 domain-containing protein [Streptomyces sp. DSM 41886]